MDSPIRDSAISSWETDDWRSATIARIGEKRWKGLYSIASIVGFVLIVAGYGIARANATWLWVSPVGVRHLTGVLTAVDDAVQVAEDPADRHRSSPAPSFAGGPASSPAAS